MNLTSVLQVIIALGLLNVWLLRYNQASAYRGASSQNLKDEFKAYGLPVWSHYLVGALKITSAIALLLGLWMAQLTFVASLLVVFLMIGAIAMHIKIKDPIQKSIPAILMLTMSVIVAVSSSAI